VSHITEYLASYATSIKYQEIPPEVAHRAKALLIDTLACGIRGYATEPGKIARRIAGHVHECDTPATILGSGQKSSAELATFANGVMIRCLDLNDTFLSKEGGHPSDNFAPVLTCGDAIHAGGKEIIVASVLAYEVFCRLCDHLNITPDGFDHATMGVISGVIGASKILGLSCKQMVEAINLAVTANISLGQIRVGEVSMWKSCALANAGRNAVFAALLAKEGVTGPSPIFEGDSGFMKAVSGPFKLEEFGGNGQPFRIMNVEIKQYPCGAFAQTAIDAAIKLRSKISSVNEITEINIGTCTFGKKALGSDAEKWHPKTPETADHSLPYTTAVALMYGPLEVGHFADEYLNNPDLLDLMQKTKVEETEECNKLYPDTSACRVEIITKSGKKFSELVQYPRGQYQSVVPDEKIEQKFYSLTRDLLAPTQRKGLLSLLWNLEQVEDVADIMELLRI
jgi:2-methylcitrate dehydratase